MTKTSNTSRATVGSIFMQIDPKTKFSDFIKNIQNSDSKQPTLTIIQALFGQKPDEINDSQWTTFVSKAHELIKSFEKERKGFIAKNWKELESVEGLSEDSILVIKDIVRESISNSQTSEKAKNELMQRANKIFGDVFEINLVDKSAIDLSQPVRNPNGPNPPNTSIEMDKEMVTVLSDLCTKLVKDATLFLGSHISHFIVYSQGEKRKALGDTMDIVGGIILSEMCDAIARNLEKPNARERFQRIENLSGFKRFVNDLLTQNDIETVMLAVPANIVEFDSKPIQVADLLTEDYCKEAFYQFVEAGIFQKSSTELVR